MQFYQKSFHHTLFLILFTVFFAIHSAPVYSHPHVFVVTSYTVVFDNQGMKGIKVTWTFDEMYSATTASEFDLDGDGSFNETESAELVKLGNESLPDFSYFTNIHIDGKPQMVKSVTDFTVRLEGGIMTYDFFVALPIKASEAMTKLKISPYDEEFYLAMFFGQDQPFILENSEQYEVKVSIGEDQDTLIYFDSIHPTAMHLEFQKNTLQK